jgi:VWFA-related protein
LKLKIPTVKHGPFRSALLLSIACTALGQETKPVPVESTSQSSDAVTRDSRMPDPRWGLVRVDVTVTDKSGKSVVGLSDKDFTLLDNQQQRKIVTFQAFNGGIQPADSLEVVMMIDELNMLVNDQSGHSELSSATRMAESFLRAFREVSNHPVVIYRLSRDGLFVTQNVSGDRNKLADEIEHRTGERRIWSPGQVEKNVLMKGIHDPILSRVIQSTVALGSVAIEERRRPGRKLMFWIGNGWRIEKREIAGLSDFSIELLTRMREARISLWSASEWPQYDTNGEAYKAGGYEEATGGASPVNDYVYREYLRGPKKDSTDLEYLSLPVLAVRSGGGTLASHDKLAALMADRVAQESRYYSITFDPPPTDVIDEYHHLEVELDKAAVRPHLFEDYYDEPVFYDQAPKKRLITVRELQTLIAEERNTSHEELEHELEGVELSERLDSADLARLEKQLHNREAREALTIIANESVFRGPAPDRVLSRPKPNSAEQKQIISNVAFYVSTTVPKLPDVFARRTTVQFHQEQPKPDQTWKTAPGHQGLHQAETSNAHIHLLNGKEQVQEENARVNRLPPLLTAGRATGGDEAVMYAMHSVDRGRLQTIGTFGPILVTVMKAARLRHSELKWARWERSDDGPLAVFQYRVPEATSWFTAEFCCLANDLETIPFKEPAPFHGEIAVNPSTGAIMRLTIQADLEWRLPLDRSDVMVEYEPVRKGPRTFICPSRAVSVSRPRRTVTIEEWGERLKVYGPFETLLNEMQFEKYRIFGSTYRILPGFTEAPETERR